MSERELIYNEDDARLIFIDLLTGEGVFELLSAWVLIITPRKRSRRMCLYIIIQ